MMLLAARDSSWRVEGEQRRAESSKSLELGIYMGAPKTSDIRLLLLMTTMMTLSRA